MALVLVLLMGAVAWADQITGEADGDILAAPHGATSNHTQQPGTTVTYSFSAMIKETGNANDDVFPGTLPVSVTRSGDWLDAGDAGGPSALSFDGYNEANAKTGTLRVTVPCGTASDTMRTMTATLVGGTSSNGKTLSSGGNNTIALNIGVTASGSDHPSCPQTPTNRAPDADPGGPYFGDEGDPVDIDGSASSDPDNDTLTYAWSYSLGTAAPGTVCEFADASAETTTITCSDNGSVNVILTVDDGDLNNAESAVLTLSNLDPSKGTTGFSFNPYSGQAVASVGFSDPGWTDIVTASWSGITGTGTNPQGPRTPVTGTGPLSGTFTATQTYSGCLAEGVGVTVSDDDGGSFSHEFATANTLGTYGVAWLAPIKDGARNIVNQKNVLPLKITIIDSCNGLPVTDRTLQIRLQSGVQNPADVTEGLSTASESVSSADTGNIMRWVDGHYQYNQTTKNLTLNLPYTIVIKDVTGGLTWNEGLTVTTAVIEAKK